MDGWGESSVSSAAMVVGLWGGEPNVSSEALAPLLWEGEATWESWALWMRLQYLYGDLSV